MVLDIGMLGKVEEVNTHSGEENFDVITMVVHIMEMAGLVIIQKEDSAQCNSDSCINVGVSARGAGKIMEVFQPLGMAWGTDANAFSMMAQKYFEGH